VSAFQSGCSWSFTTSALGCSSDPAVERCPGVSHGLMTWSCCRWGEFSTGSSALWRWFVGSRRLPIEPRRDWECDWWMFFIGYTSTMYRALDLEILVSCSWTLGKPGLHSHRWHRRKPQGRTTANRLSRKSTFEGQGQLSLSAVESWRKLWRALELKCFKKKVGPKITLWLFNIAMERSTHFS